MSITLSQINDLIRQRYDAIGDNFFSDDFLYKALWQAEGILAKEGWIIENTYTTTSVASTREYAFPTNALAVREVRYKNDKIRKIPLAYDPKSDASEPTGTPTDYAIWDGILFLFPTPAVSADTIQVRVFEYPQMLSASSSLNVPDEYQLDLVDYVLGQMALKDGNVQLYREYMAAWQQTVQRAVKNKARILRADRSAVVKDTYFSDDVNITMRGYLSEYQV